jgi:hypothetical protein
LPKYVLRFQNRFWDSSVLELCLSLEKTGQHGLSALQRFLSPSAEAVSFRAGALLDSMFLDGEFD